VEEHNSDVRFRPEVEIWPFRACTMKIMHHNSYLRPKCGNFHVLQKIGVEEHDDYGEITRSKERMYV